MATPATTRKPRQPKTTTAAQKVTLPPQLPWQSIQDAVPLIEQARACLTAPESFESFDLGAWWADATASAASLDGTDALHAQHAAAVRAVYKGRHIKGSAPLPLETLTGCGDPEPRTAAFTRPAVPPVGDAPPAADFVISFSKARQVAPLPALTPEEEALATDVFGPEKASEPGLQLSPVLRMEGPITGAEIARVREDSTLEQGSEPTPEHEGETK